MKLRNKTIRVFLSSTFEDLKMERDALQQKAFRNLREYCHERGWQFQAVDLRWGINNEATIDQRTMEICLREIARCQEQSPRPNFIVLLGERYGWRPLPDRILQSVGEKMKPEMPPEIQSLFRQWYELDENQLPEQVWKLRAREGRYIDYSEYEKTIQKPLVAFFTRWSAENLPDPELPENKTNPLALQRLSMERSATEQEIQAGAFGVEDAREHVFAFFRNMPECPVENLTWHDADQNPVQRLRSHLKSYLHEAKISEFSAGWDKAKNQPDTAHLEKLSDDVENSLKVIIDREIESYQLANEHELEQAAHEAFASERTFGFSGRENDIATICEYATQTNNTPFVVWGESGTGKSTLLAMAARKVQETLPHAHVITRFIGVTGKSANGHTLLADICRNLCMLYGGETAEIPEDPAKLQYAFRGYLAKATEEHPLVLFLDALDQLNDGDPARLLQWMPEVLPPNVKLITSTLKGLSFDVLKERKEQAPFFYEITPLTATDGRNALAAWLKRANRTLQSYQTEQIIKDFECAGCAPLYLHLAFEQAQHWESYARRQRLGRDIPEMIEEFYGNLSRPEAHGSIVEKVLTAIRCAKQGLSDDEILGVLAADNDFWNSFGIQTYHIYDDGEKTTTTSRLIPPVLWIRLYHDLEYYLTRRNAPGGEVITFYHRQLAEAVDSMYLQRPGLRQKRHKELANFFTGKRLLIKETAPLIANVRVSDELPWLLTKGEDWDTLTNTLCNLDFIQAKAAAKMTYELVNDFNEALEVIPDNQKNIEAEKARQTRIDRYTNDLIAYANGKIKELEIPESITPWSEDRIEEEIERIRRNPDNADKLKDFSYFIGGRTAIFQKYASEFQYHVYDQAWHFANDGPVGKSAKNISLEIRKSLLLSDQNSRPEWNPLPFALKIIQSPDKQLKSITITPDGKQAILGGEKCCFLLSLTTGQVIKKMEGERSKTKVQYIGGDWGYPFIEEHNGSNKIVSITPDGKYTFSINSRKIYGINKEPCLHWDISSGKVIQTLICNDACINTISVTPDGRWVILGSDDKTCIVWDLKSGDKPKILEGHISKVTSVSITSDGKRALSVSDDYKDKPIIWDIEKGEKLRLLDTKSESVLDKIETIFITPDGKLALCFGYKRLTYFDLTNGNILKTTNGISLSYGLSPSFTSDGRRALSASSNDCVLWDITTGNKLYTLSGHKSSIKAVSITPDGRYGISYSNDDTIILWDLEKGKTITENNSNKLSPFATSITPDGKLAFFGSSDSNSNASCTLMNLSKRIVQHDILATPNHKNRPHLNLYNYSVNNVAITPNGQLGISGITDYSSTGFSKSTDEVLNSINVYDLLNGNILKNLKGHNDRIIDLSITDDGRYAISSSKDESCILWDLVTGEKLKTYKGHDFKVKEFIIGQGRIVDKICLIPDGKLVIFSTYMAGCKIWNLQKSEIIPITPPMGKTVSITPDGKWAISIYKIPMSSMIDSIIVWNLKTGKQSNIIKHLTNSPSSVSVTPDGKRVITVTGDGTCFLCNIENGEIIANHISAFGMYSVKYLPQGIFYCNLYEDFGFLHSDKKMLCPGIAISTIKQIWDFELKRFTEPLVYCPLCGHRFAPPVSVLATIEKITKEAGLKPEQSPCLELPDEAWEEPGLLGNCPNCGEALKFNPFLAGGDLHK